MIRKIMAIIESKKSQFRQLRQEPEAPVSGWAGIDNQVDGPYNGLSRRDRIPGRPEQPEEENF